MPSLYPPLTPPAAFRAAYTPREFQHEEQDAVQVCQPPSLSHPARLCAFLLRRARVI